MLKRVFENAIMGFTQAHKKVCNENERNVTQHEKTSHMCT